MTPCNDIHFAASEADYPSLYLDELFDLDTLCAEEGILINRLKP